MSPRTAVHFVTAWMCDDTTGNHGKRTQYTIPRNRWENLVSYYWSLDNISQNICNITQKSRNIWAGWFLLEITLPRALFVTYLPPLIKYHFINWINNHTASHAIMRWQRSQREERLRKLLYEAFHNQRERNKVVNYLESHLRCMCET